MITFSKLDNSEPVMLLLQSIVQLVTKDITKIQKGRVHAKVVIQDFTVPDAWMPVKNVNRKNIAPELNVLRAQTPLNVLVLIVAILCATLTPIVTIQVYIIQHFLIYFNCKCSEFKKNCSEYTKCNHFQVQHQRNIDGHTFIQISCTQLIRMRLSFSTTNRVCKLIFFCNIMYVFVKLLNVTLKLSMTKFRLCSYYLEIEIGRFEGIPDMIKSEYHFC